MSGRLLVAALGLAAAGCGPTSPCGLPNVGDPGAEPELEVFSIGASGEVVELADGASIDIVIPPQGGRVVFAGARVNNMEACGVTLAGVLRDPVSNQIRLDTRTINLEPQPEGTGGSDPGDISTFSNIPVCSNQWADQDVFDQTFALEVSVTSADGLHVVSRTTQVVPRCDPADVGCECLCKQGYVLGETCGGQP